MKIHIIWSIIFCSFLSIATPGHSTALPFSTGKMIPVADIYKKIADLKTKDIQKMIGRKLTLKEKFSFFILKQKLRHPPKESSNLADTAFIFGVGAIALFVIGLFVPLVLIGSLVTAIVAIVSGTVAKKRDPSNWKGGVAKLLGWITLGLIALLVALVIAALSAIF